MSPWSDMCAIDNIQTTPLSPFIDQVVALDNEIFTDHMIYTGVVI